jgi:hypothetical protein
VGIDGKEWLKTERPPDGVREQPVPADAFTNEQRGLNRAADGNKVF